MITPWHVYVTTCDRVTFVLDELRFQPVMYKYYINYECIQLRLRYNMDLVE